MENHPKFMVVLMALAKIGVVAALINSNLTDEGLTHSINIAKCRGCVYQHKLENVLAKVANNLKAPIDKSPFQVITIGEHSHYEVNAKRPQISDEKYKFFLSDKKLLILILKLFIKEEKLLFFITNLRAFCIHFLQTLPSESAGHSA